MFGRTAAFLGVLVIGLVWVIAWAPMALYCAAAALLNVLRGGVRRPAG